MELQGVQGIVLDAATLFRVDEGGSVQFNSEAPQFLLRMRYSGLSIGALSPAAFPGSVSAIETLLEDLGVLKLMRVVSEELESFGSMWAVPPSSSIYVTTQKGGLEDVIRQGWTVVRFGCPENDRGNPADTNVQRLHDIFFAVARLNRRALGSKLVVVGYFMKWSRELDFLKRGAFPLEPAESGLSFVAIHLDRPLEEQLRDVDVLLHKATDEMSGSVGLRGDSPPLKRMNELQAFLTERPHICVVDPLDRIRPLLDRNATQDLLRSLKSAGKRVLRPPRSAEVSTFEEPTLSQALESANMELPAIVKAQLACGSSDAHNMAVVFRKDGFQNLPVPLPAVVQEYVDHGGLQRKFYVFGEKLLFARRKSTPDASVLAKANGNPASICFNSLQSLPLAETPEGRISSSGEDSEDMDLGAVQEDLDLDAVEETASMLRRTLGLTIMGFDLVVQEGTKDYVIVDVNYFPSFKDVPAGEAIPAFWEALLFARRQWDGGKEI